MSSDVYNNKILFIRSTEGNIYVKLKIGSGGKLTVEENDNIHFYYLL